MLEDVAVAVRGSASPDRAARDGGAAGGAAASAAGRDRAEHADGAAVAPTLTPRPRRACTPAARPSHGKRRAAAARAAALRAGHRHQAVDRERAGGGGLGENIGLSGGLARTTAPTRSSSTRSTARARAARQEPAPPCSARRRRRRRRRPSVRRAAARAREQRGAPPPLPPPPPPRSRRRTRASLEGATGAAAAAEAAREAEAAEQAARSRMAAPVARFHPLLRRLAASITLARRPTRRAEAPGHPPSSPAPP